MKPSLLERFSRYLAKLPPQLESLITEEAKLPIEEVVEELLGASSLPLNAGSAYD